MHTSEWLHLYDACNPAKQWVAAQPDQSPAALVAACPRGEWLLWLAEGGYPIKALLAAVRPAWLRAVRKYAPLALDRAGLHEHAARLRALPDDVTPAAAAEAARAVEAAIKPASGSETLAAAAKAAEAADGWAAVASRAAHHAALCASDAGLDPATEHARCANEVRTALPDLAAWWTDELATGKEG